MVGDYISVAILPRRYYWCGRRTGRRTHRSWRRNRRGKELYGRNATHLSGIMDRRVKGAAEVGAEGLLVDAGLTWEMGRREAMRSWLVNGAGERGCRSLRWAGAGDGEETETGTGIPIGSEQRSIPGRKCAPRTAFAELVNGVYGLMGQASREQSV